MADTVSIDELCHHARCACLIAGLTPVAWRWSIGAHLLFKQQAEWMMQAYGLHDPGKLPPGCLGIYEGLPVYRMGNVPAFPHPAVACLGTREKPAF